MTNFRPYGAAAILVSAGIMITGVLWYDRPAPYVSGEDLAELTAAVNERLAIGYLTGTNSPTYPSNAILPWIEWRGLYDSVLVRARAIATNAPAELPAVWFLDASEPLPASGDLLVRNGCFWAITAVQTNKHPEGAQTNYTWRLFSDTNHSDAIPATSTRRSFGPPYITFPPAASNSYPFSEFFYPETNAVRGFSGSWKNGNWWTGIGMGTNVYKWGCENWHGIYGEDLAITYIDGDGFALSTNTVHIPYTDTSFHYIDAASTQTATNRLYAALYSVSASGRDSARFAVSDGGSDLALNIVLSDKTKTVSEGSTATFTVRPRDEIPSGSPIRSVSLSAAGAVNVWPSTLLFGNNNWGTPQTVIVSAPDNALPGDSAGLVKIIYQNTIAYLAVKIIDDDGGYDDIKLDDSLITTTKGAAGEVGVGLVNGSTNFYVTTGKWITSNNLNEARNVLTNLTRTIYVCPSSALAYTNCAETWTSTNINWSVATNCPAVLPWDPYEQFAGLVFTAVPATNYTDSVWNGRLGSYHAELYRWDLGAWWDGNGWFGDGPGWAYQWYADFNATLRSKYLTGCSLPYPSDYAIANGLVSRVTVYAVAYNEASVNDNLTYPLDGNYYIGIDETLTWFELDGSNPEPNDWDGINLGFIDKVAELPSVPTNVCSKYRYDGFAGMPIDAAGLPIAGARLSLVGTFAAGAGCKDFAFGTQALVPPDPAPDYRYSHTGIETYSTLREAPDTLDEQWAVEFDRNIVVTHFVVIVDWNWTHCNPSRPFVPTPHTPEWASTNAP